MLPLWVPLRAPAPQASPNAMYTHAAWGLHLAYWVRLVRVHSGAPVGRRYAVCYAATLYIAL